MRGTPFPVTAARKATERATRLTVSWNCRNFRTLPKMERPHITALMIDPKLSSRMIMSDASFATSVPAIPWITGLGFSGFKARAQREETELKHDRLKLSR